MVVSILLYCMKMCKVVCNDLSYRRWQQSKDSVSWIVTIPETRIYEHLLGGWQCAIAVDIVNEGVFIILTLLCQFAFLQIFTVK